MISPTAASHHCVCAAVQVFIGVGYKWLQRGISLRFCPKPRTNYKKGQRTVALLWWQLTTWNIWNIVTNTFFFLFLFLQINKTFNYCKCKCVLLFLGGLPPLVHELSSHGAPPPGSFQSSLSSSCPLEVSLRALKLTILHHRKHIYPACLLMPLHFEHLLFHPAIIFTKLKQKK